jgi:hypothetical protein
MATEGWRSLLTGDGLAGWTSGCIRHWSRSGNELVGTDGKVDPDNAGGRIETGDPDWANFEYSTRIRPISGVMAQLHYRISGNGKCWYTLDLEPQKGTVSISRVDMRPGGAGRRILQSTRVPLDLGTNYEVRVVAQYSTLSAYLDEKQVVTVSDVADPILSGQVGVAIWMARSAFADPRIRLLG